MKSATPKVLHEVGGRPMLARVLDAARDAGCERIVVVVGHGAERVREAVAADDVEWVTQEERLGTGHALAQAEAAVDGSASLLVLSGDVPLVRPGTLAALFDAAGETGSALAVAEVAEPGALGRVEATPEGAFERIVEAADASREQLANRRINAGLYVLPAPEVFGDLRQVGADNAKGEIYLTDALAIGAAHGRRPALLTLADATEALGVNDRLDLARADKALRRRTVEALALSGVTFLDPDRVVVDSTVAVGRDTVVHPDAALSGSTRIGAGCVIGQGACLRDAVVGDGTRVEPYCVVEGATIGDDCRVGPFARLRPGASLARGVKVGNFVEIKNATLGEGAKAGHLAYLGDAAVGAGANIGAGAVTCNYDGRHKHRTVIGEGAFIGSDTMLVAPVTVGKGASTGAGSVISQDVPDGALAVERTKTRIVERWAERRGRTKND